VTNVLLLTSTIRPRADQPQLKLVDPLQRLADYRQALAFQCGLLASGVVDRIVYADNSGHDLQALKAEFRSPAIEWVSFFDLDYDPSYHRGYGEFRLVDRAHEQSAVLSALAPDDRVWKVTGRYVVRNLARVMGMTPRGFDLLCDVRGRWAEMGFMAWSRHGYERHVRGLWGAFATPKAPEFVLAERLAADDRRSARIVTSFYWPPVIVGRRGSDGTPFQGRWTPVKLAGQAALKLVQWPARAMLARSRLRSASAP
jgi:hypothetical protein